MITPKKWEQLRQTMQQLNINEADIDEKFILGSGSGGQKVNKSNTCVYLKHHPTQHTIKCQKTRSREDNRYFARKRLCEKISDNHAHIVSEKKKAISKLKHQKKRRSRRAKQKILDNKHHQSSIKAQRKKPDIDRD